MCVLAVPAAQLIWQCAEKLAIGYAGPRAFALFKAVVRELAPRRIRIPSQSIEQQSWRTFF